MKPLTTLMATAGMVVIGSASASAGPCAKQITELTKELAASDAGTGPTTGTPAPTAGDEKGQHPPTAIMGQQTEGRALSPGDTQRQSGIKSGASRALALARKLDAQNLSECKDAADLAQELSRQ
jgi:methenyltetrahydromethanopterin cyclohydrolase